MTPKFRNVLEHAIDIGIKRGHTRAHKHCDVPQDHVLFQYIEEAIWSELYEWFDFDEKETE